MAEALFLLIRAVLTIVVIDRWVHRPAAPAISGLKPGELIGKRL
jgi:hypothetical protein